MVLPVLDDYGGGCHGGCGVDGGCRRTSLQATAASAALGNSSR
jgi:hypothetical protein